MSSKNAVGKRTPQIYSATSTEMTVTSGDNSWFIKFRNISSDVKKCGSLTKIYTINVDNIMRYFITQDQVGFDTSIRKIRQA